MANRELEFRAYNRRLKCWEYFTISPQWLYDDDKSFVRDAMRNGEVNQYTGLKDKNGVEIYEGDIVTWMGAGSPSSIYWSKRKLGWGLMSSTGLYDANMIVDMPDVLGLEIIGNVYENPELMGKNQ